MKSLKGVRLHDIALLFLFFYMSVTSLKKTFGAHSHLFNATQTTATISDVTICDVVFRYVFKALYVSYLTVFFFMF